MYTREEAIEKVLAMKKKFGHIPTEEEYEACEDIAKLKDLMAALNATNYAAVNIAVLRELRRREGKKVYIAQLDDEHRWRGRNSAADSRREKRERRQQEDREAHQASKKQEKTGRGREWSKEKVAEALMRFYERYGRFPTGEDFNADGAFKTMGEAAPCGRTLYKNLGKHKSEWLANCAAILGTPPKE